MKHIILITLALLLSIAASAEDSRTWKTLRFDTPAGFKVIEEKGDMFTGKAPGMVVTIARIDDRKIPMTAQRLAQTMEKSAADNLYSKLGELQDVAAEQLSIQYAEAEGKNGFALIARITEMTNNYYYIAIIAYSDGSKIAAEAIIESFCLAPSAHHVRQPK